MSEITEFTKLADTIRELRTANVSNEVLPKVTQESASIPDDVRAFIIDAACSAQDDERNILIRAAQLLQKYPKVEATPTYGALTLHLAQPQPEVWQVLERGHVIASFSELQGLGKRNAEAWIATHTKQASNAPQTQLRPVSETLECSVCDDSDSPYICTDCVRDDRHGINGTQQAGQIDR